MVCPMVLPAQNHEIDSLYSVLKTEKEDTNKVNTLDALSRELADLNNYHTSDSLVHITLNLSEKLNYTDGKAGAYYNLGVIYTYKCDYPNALKNHMLSLKISTEKGDKSRMANSYVCIGIIYEKQGNYPDALKDFLSALKIYEETGNKNGIAYTYNIIGIIYYRESDYPNALKNYFASQKKYEEIGDKENIANAYVNIGIVYNDQGDYAEALKNFSNGLKIKEETGAKSDIADVEINIGIAYKKLGDYTQSLKFHSDALEINKGIGNKSGMADSYIAIGEVYTKTKKYNEAKEYLGNGLQIAKEIGAKELICQDYEGASELDSAIGDYKRALSDYTNYIAYRDSLKNEANTKKLVSEQMQYDFDKKQAAEKAEQDKKDTIAAADKHKQQIITASVGLGLFLVLIFSGLLFNRFRITQRQKIIIERQKALVEEKNKEMHDSITYAKRLQDAILPPLNTIKKHLPESFVLYKPKDIVAGDFYWMEQTESALFIAAADCTGHGVPGAMVSVVCSNALNRAVKEFKIRDTGKVLDKVRELVLETFEKSESNVQDGMDISLASLTPSEGGIHIQWSGAFNSLWYVQNGEMKELAADKQPIGKTDNPKPFTTHTLTLPNGEGKGGAMLYLFTDGYADQFGGPKGKKLKYKQLQQLIIDNAQLAMDEQKNMLNQTFENWRGGLEQVDDILIIGIKV